MSALLTIALDAAVPLWVADLRRLPLEERQAASVGLADIVASKGDVLLFGGGKRGEAAEAFNALAKGLALLSFQPGGVEFAGRRWETR